MIVGVVVAGRSVKGISSGLGDCIDDGRRITSVLSGKVVDGNAQFLYSVRTRTKVRNAPAWAAVRGGVVNHEVIRFGALPVGIQVDSVFGREDIACSLRIG